MLLVNRNFSGRNFGSCFPDLKRFFAPRAVAMIGATEDLGKFGGRCMRQMLDFGYRGALYPVNPKRDVIFGLRCYASVATLPDTPDHVGIVLPAHLVPAALEQCAERSVPFVTVFSSGFREVGSAQGAADQQRIVDIARAGNIRLMGPNCNGMINFVDGFALTSTATIQGPRRSAGDIGVVSQSGGAGQVNIMWRAQQSGLGISYQVSCGNAADLDLVDYASFMLESESTKVVLMLAEQLADGDRLRMLASRAADLDKPIVMIKVGRSEAGSQAAASHTGAITGADDVCDAALRQMGIVRVHDCNELYETAMLLRQGRRPQGRRAAAMSISGGNLVMAADLGALEGIEWPPYSGETTRKLAELLPGFSSAINPTDLTAAAIGKKDAYKNATETILSDANVDILIPILTINSVADVRAVAQVAACSDKPVAILWTGCASDDPLLTQEVLVAEGHAVYRDALPCLKSVWRAMQYAEFRRRRLDATDARPEDIDVGAAMLMLEQTDGPLSGDRSRALLQHYGLPVAIERLNTSSEAAWKAASRIDGSDARIEGVPVPEMITGAQEMFVRVFHDVTFGPVLAFGLGGVYVEVLNDVVFRLAPLTFDEAQRALTELRTFKLLQGVRGKSPADIDAAVDAIVRISWLAFDLGDWIAEMDISPLCILPKGYGARVVDALIVPHDIVD